MVLDKEKYNSYMNEYMKARYKKRREEVIIKLGGECKNCHSVDNLELDHIDPKSKFNTIARLSSASEVIFQAEVAKCQLLCRPCHMKKTMVDLGQLDARENHGTLSSYKYCKCNLCKKAQSDYIKEYRKTHIRKRDRDKQSKIDEEE